MNHARSEHQHASLGKPKRAALVRALQAILRFQRVFGKINLRMTPMHMRLLLTPLIAE